MLARCSCRTLGDAFSVSAVHLSLQLLFFGNGNRVSFVFFFKTQEQRGHKNYQPVPTTCVKYSSVVSGPTSQSLTL